MSLHDYKIIYWMSDVDLLHPEKQFKLAEAMVRNANKKEIYINTFSALFVESMEVLACKYDVDVEFLYGDDLIKPKQLSELYDYLGGAYDRVDRIRAENLAKMKYSGMMKND